MATTSGRILIATSNDRSTTLGKQTGDVVDRRQRAYGMCTRTILHSSHLLSVSLTPIVMIRYDDAIFGLMTQWSDHPTQPLTEIEVFVGFILNKRGFQGNRQRDRSIKLKDEYDRIAAGITRKMQTPAAATFEEKLRMLELCLACVHVGCEKSGVVKRRARKSPEDGQSFRVLAASALMRELGSASRNVSAKHGRGGFVGVRGAGVSVWKGDAYGVFGSQGATASVNAPTMLSGPVSM